jgi:sulfite exporter TauE/SafE
MALQTSLALTALFMGLAGGPHCVAMCGPACGALKSTPESPFLPILFHGGRLIGYASLGAVAAASVGRLAWFSDQTLVLKPVWTFFHVAILCWGIVLFVTARQPQWADRYGRLIWAWARKGASTSTSALASGISWALMPCGLLYSALMIAALNAQAVGGAITMAAFAIGTTVSLLIAPWLWLRIRQGRLGLHESTAMRVAGLLLVAAAGWAIWMDLTHGIKVWCS